MVSRASLRAPILAVLLFAATAGAARGQAPDPMAELTRLYTLGAAIDVCELDVTEAEQSLLELAIETADAASKKPLDELEILYDKIVAEMEKDKDNICKSRGAEFAEEIKKIK